MARNFTEILDDMSDGKVSQQLTTDLAELVEAVEETGLSGKVTLTITVKPDGKGRVVTAGSVKTTKPRPKLEASLFFTGSKGSLHREDPRQQKLPMTKLPENRAGLTVVGGGENDPEKKN